MKTPRIMALLALKKAVSIAIITGIAVSMAACSAKNAETESQIDDKTTVMTRATETEMGETGMSEPNQTIDPVNGTTTESTTEETSDTQSLTPTPVPLGKTSVTDAYKKTHGSGKSKYTSKVPKVTIDGVDTAAFNKEILNKFKSTAKNNDYKVWYTYYIGKTYVSIQIEVGFTGEETGGDAPNYYYAYNVSRKTGKKLSRAQMLKELGISNKKFNSRVKKAVIKWWRKSFGKNYLKKIKKMDMTHDYNNSIKKKTLNKAIPYVNTKGKVCFLISELELPVGIGEWDMHGTC